MELNLNDKSLVESLITPNWAYCFNKECEHADSCFRFLSAKFKPEAVECGMAVYPGACREGKCRHYLQARTANMAWGFSMLYKNVKASDLKSLRELTKELLGGKTSYYRYHRGEKKLTPEQQDSVRRLFTKHGYSDVVFDFTAKEVNLWNSQEA